MLQTRSFDKLKLVAKAILVTSLISSFCCGQEPTPEATSDNSNQPSIFSKSFTIEGSEEICWDMRLPRDERFTGPDVITAEGEEVESEFVSREDSVSAGNTLTNIYFLIDTSDAKNRKNGIEKSKEIVRELLTRGKPHQRFGLGILGERSLTISKLGSPAHDIIEATKRSENFPAQSKTYLYRSLIQSIESIPFNPENRAAIVVLTDGISEDGGEVAHTAADVIAAAKEKDLAIITIALERLPAFNAQATSLSELSKATNAPSLHLKRSSTYTYKLGSDVLDRLLSHLDSGGRLALEENTPDEGLVAKIQINSSGVTYSQELPSPSSIVSGGDEGQSDSGKATAPKKNTKENESGKSEKEDEKAEKSDSDKTDGDSDSAEEEPFWKTYLQDHLIAIIVAGAVVLALIALPIILLIRKRSNESSEFQEAQPAQYQPESVVTPSPVPRTGTFLEEIFEPHTSYPILTSAIRIGRGIDNDVRLENDSVSKHHAEIHKTSDGRFLIQDLASGNGIFVNGNRVDSVELKPDDTIEFGEVHLKFIIR